MEARVLPEIQLLKCCLKKAWLISAFILFEHSQEMRIKLTWFSLSFGIQMHLFCIHLSQVCLRLLLIHILLYVYLKKKKKQTAAKDNDHRVKEKGNSRYPGKTQKSTSGAEISRNLLKPQTEIVILAPLAGNDSNFHF